MIIKKHFVLFACCILVKGARKNIICDLQRQEIFYINKDVFNLLEQLERYPYQFVIKNSKTEEISNIESLIQFLIEQEIGFFCDDISAFPKISMQYETPSIIFNSLIDYGVNSSHDITEISNQLNDLGCKHLQIRFQTEISTIELEEILAKINVSRIQSIELILPYFNNAEEELVQLLNRHIIISEFIIYNSPQNNQFSKLNTAFNFTTVNIDICKSCGVITKEHFTLHLETFRESMFHNSCLYQKISIDSIGNIKNCPSMTVSFGNVRNTTLAEAIEKEGFKKYWNINKDKIHVCKDCEFRYICTDCRAYVEDPEDILSKPLKCGYNPYTGEWAEWSTNPLKQKAIDYYGIQN